MTEEELTAIEARMRGLPMWTRPQHLLQDVPALVAEVRRLQALTPPGSYVVTDPCARCLHDRVTHLDTEHRVCESPCDCPGFEPAS